MRSVLFAAPLVATAYAATSLYTITVPSGTTSIVETLTYSNPATQYLTETNSAGVVTGMPKGSAVPTGVPHAVTSQPPPATIPAGLPTGTTVIYYNGTAGFTSFTVSVGSKSTTVLGQAGTASGSVFVPAGQSTPTGGPHHHQTGTATGGSNNQGTQSSSASASSSSGAADNVKVASAGMIGLAGLFAALL